MSRKRLLVLAAAALVVGFFVARRLRTPVSTIQEQPPPPPAAEPHKPALQADAEGHYAPGYAFSVGRFRFTGFTLRPDALVTYVSSDVQQSMVCLEATISAASVHLRCDDPAVGVVTIEGRFLTRLATPRLDAPVVSAVVTFRGGSGEILYRARDSFVWEPGR
jgi:hypothetical protein